MRVLLIGVLSMVLVGCSCPTGSQAITKACAAKGCLYSTAEIPQIEQTSKASKSVRTATRAHAKNKRETANTSLVVSKVGTPASPQESKAAKSASPSTTPGRSIAPSQPTDEAKSVVGANVSAAEPSGAETKIIPPQASNGFDKDRFASPITTYNSSVTIPQPPENAKSAGGAPEKVAAASPVSERSASVLERARTTIASKMEYPASVEFEDMTRAVRTDAFGRHVDTICGHVRGKSPFGGETGKRAFVYLVTEDIAFVDYGNPGSAAGNTFRKICTTGY